MCDNFRSDMMKFASNWRIWFPMLATIVTLYMVRGQRQRDSVQTTDREAPSGLFALCLPIYLFGCARPFRFTENGSRQV